MKPTNRKPTFQTPHFDVFKNTLRERALDGTSQTLHRFEAQFREGREHDWPVGVVVVRGTRGRGPKPVTIILASYHSDWTYGEIMYELLLGVRGVVGPMSLDLINYEASIRQGIILSHATADCDDKHELMPLFIDSYLPQSLRERLLLSVIDDTWAMLMKNELAPVTT